MIQALVFDFDGLIIDTETPLIDAYAAVHTRHGVPFDRAVFIRSVGHAEYAFDPWHGFSPHADRAALELERRTVKSDLLARQPVLPGAAELITAARSRNLRIGLASNSEHAWVEPHLRRIGLLPHFDFLACREDAASPKPEPDLYRLVLNRFGLRGDEAIAFEDSATGVLAAKRANLWAVAVPGPSTAHHDFSPADLRATSLAEFSLDHLLTRFAGQAASPRG
ncbi:HAD family hydrolase [Opitutus terrae]|uniref:HAD-superfamily hydrolase, subfamily IA, variant 3 n=1 Tax=Opitutus terrae (strain DSM 11246 / JCM 15787 / PB90-1) TaxID=452637 RepID=B1ZTS1_OPITP|nr:HAD-IA family hydrolase [Opitutus terrae]ACB74857.1 HAD-superfamily hydrolase, subfamily IA, variant 3 [Opitutus terrae PB90-1]